MQMVGGVAEILLGLLMPFVAMALANRLTEGKPLPGRAWSLRLRGDAPPYPAKDVSGRLVVGERLLWVTDSGAGDIDLTDTGLYPVRTEAPSPEKSTLVCIDGLGTQLRLSGAARVDRELRQHRMPENPVAPTVSGPSGPVFGGPPAVGLALGTLVIAGLVFLGTRPGAPLDDPPGQVLVACAGLTLMFVLPISLVGFLVVRPRTHLRMRRALATYRTRGQPQLGGQVPAPRPAPVALMIPPAAGELSWHEAADLVQRRADIEQWKRVGKESAHSGMPWWEDVVFALLVVGSFLGAVAWSRSVMVTDALDVRTGPLVGAMASLLVAGVWISERRENERHRRLLSAPSVAVPYVLVPDPAPDTKRTLLLLAARELGDVVEAGHTGWLSVSLTRDQRRLTPAGRAGVHGTIAPGQKVAVLIDGQDRETDSPLTTVDDDDVRRLVTAPDVPPPRSRRWRKSAEAS